MVSLRAHHLLCFLGFRGLGYNEPFTQNFARIRSKIIHNPELIIKLKTNADNICQNCPQLLNDICIDDDKVRKKDEYIIDFLTTDEITVKNAYEKLKFFKEEKLKDLCQNCEWYNLGYCLEGFRNMKQSKSHILYTITKNIK